MKSWSPNFNTLKNIVVLWIAMLVEQLEGSEQERSLDFSAIFESVQK